MPQEIERAGLAVALRTTRWSAPGKPSRSWRVGEAAEADEQSQYVIPLAFRKRTLFKMDFAEALYISELRTGAAGHFSYRNVAYAMYEAVAQTLSAAGEVLPRDRRARAGGLAEAVENSLDSRLWAAARVTHQR